SPNPSDAGGAGDFEVRYTVENRGTSNVQTITPTLQPLTIPGALNVECVPSACGGAAPGMTLLAGTSATFIWRFDASANGRYTFTAEASGDDLAQGCCGTIDAYAAAVSAEAVVTPLRTQLSLVPNPAGNGLGTDFEAHLLVTNAGPGTVDNVTPSLWPLSVPGQLSLVCGPAGAVLGTGQSVTFTWRFDAVTNGAVVFTATASGDDQMVGPPTVDTYSERVSATEIISPLQGSLVVVPNPSSVGPGYDFEVRFTVVNTGTGNVNNIQPRLWPDTVPGLIPAPPCGPGCTLPNPGMSLSGGQSATFTWRYDAVANGTVVFTASASGYDVFAGGVDPNAYTQQIQATAVINPLRTALTMSPNPTTADGTPAADFTLSFTVTNAGAS